jgi:hypothetical protein
MEIAYELLSRLSLINSAIYVSTHAEFSKIYVKVNSTVKIAEMISLMLLQKLK